MNRQKGQSAVELALILPLFCMMAFGMIYGGMIFIDYLSLNNSARQVAREISLTADKDKQIEIATKFENKNSAYFNKITSLYDAEPDADITVSYVKIKIDLNLNENSLPKILSVINFPPKKLNPIEIVMPLENKFEKEEEKP